MLNVVCCNVNVIVNASNVNSKLQLPEKKAGREKQKAREGLAFALDQDDGRRQLFRSIAIY
jgi:hypothetical protein